MALLAAAQTAGTQQNGGGSQNPQPQKLPTNVILVKGAWPSASDSLTPLPESGAIADSVYTNSYFGLTYDLPPGWIEKYSGPPPSDRGYYVLAQIRPEGTGEGASQGSILIAAQDLFFSFTPASNALELINHIKETLQADYKVDRPPTPVVIGNRSFVRLDYYSPVAGLHWYLLATQIRCHVLQFVFTGRDTKFMDGLLQDMNKMKFPTAASPTLGAGGDDAPVCVPDYARDENVIERVDPIFTERRFNPIPVRLIIDREGKVKHIHFLSAFPDQARTISDALWQWKFKPYLRGGLPVELETGIMFGPAPRSGASSTIER